jgi:hypothetical protein
MIKQIFSIILLCVTTSLIASDNHFYAFVMHATHDATYDHDTWQKSVELIESLSKQCEDTAYDESFGAFLASVDAAVKTIQTIVALYHNKSGLNLDMHLLSEPFENPTHGLFISIDSALEYTSENRCAYIESIIANCKTACSKDKEQRVLDILQIINKVVSLSVGDVWIRVHNLESYSTN